MVYTSALPLDPMVDSSHLDSHASLAAPRDLMWLSQRCREAGAG